MKKKTPLIKAKPSKKEQAKRILMNRPKRGILRYKLDQEIFVTNSPELIRQLKEEGYVIDMKRVPKKVDPGWQGRYFFVSAPLNEAFEECWKGLRNDKK